MTPYAILGGYLLSWYFCRKAFMREFSGRGADSPPGGMDVLLTFVPIVNTFFALDYFIDIENLYERFLEQFPWGIASAYFGIKRR